MCILAHVIVAFNVLNHVAVLLSVYWFMRLCCCLHISLCVFTVVYISVHEAMILSTNKFTWLYCFIHISSRGCVFVYPLAYVALLLCIYVFTRWCQPHICFSVDWARVSSTGINSVSALFFVHHKWKLFRMFYSAINSICWFECTVHFS